MSSLAITNATALTLPVNLKSHGPGRHRGLMPDAASPANPASGSSSAAASAQGPTDGVQSLFSRLMESAEQVIGATGTAASAVASAATSAAAAASAVTPAGAAHGVLRSIV
jgi:hypothetical protein